MKKNLLAVVLTAFCCTLPLGAQEQKAQPEATAPAPKKVFDMDSFMKNYYRNPAPEKIGNFLREIAGIPKQKQANVFVPVSFFLMEVYRVNSPRLGEWGKICADSEIMTVFHMNAMFLADTPEAQAAIKEIVASNPKFKVIVERAEKERARKPLDLTAMEIQAPSLLDGCWGAYFASGNTKYVDAVLRCAVKPVQEKTLDLTVSAARWSAAALSQEQPEIAAAVKAFLKKASPEERKRFADGLSNEVQEKLLGEVLVPMQKKTQGTPAATPEKSPR